MQLRREWLYGAAGLAFLAFAALALATSNALYFSVGTLAATALLAPLWWQHPRYLLFALVIYFTIQDGFLDPLGRNVTLARVIPDVLLLIACVTRLVVARQRKERLAPTDLGAPLVFLLIVAFLSMLINHISVGQAVQGPYTLLRYALVFYLAANSDFRAREVRGFVRLIAGLIVFEGAVSLVQFAQIHIAGHATLFANFAVQGTMLQFNLLGVFLSLATLLILAFYTPTADATWRRGTDVVLGIAIFTIVLATSRQSLGAIIIGGLVFAVANYKALAQSRHWQPAAITAVIMVAALGVGYLALKLPYTKTALAHGAAVNIQQVQSKTGNGTPGASNELTTSPEFYKNPRLYAIVNGGGAILHQSPLFGLGPGTYGSQPTFNNQAFYDKLHVGLLLSVPGSTLVADVEWLNIFGQLGLLGLAGFLWLFVSIGRLGYRVWRQSHDEVTQRLGLLSIALIPAFLFLGFFGPNFEIRQISIFLWLIPGLAASRWRQENAASANDMSVDQQATSHEPWLEETLKRWGLPKVHA